MDDAEVKNTLARGQRRSKHAEIWAVNAFNKWQISSGYSTEELIVDIFEPKHIRPFVDMLFKFNLKVRKADGSLYPPSSYV